MKFRCVQDNRDSFPVRVMCRLLGVSESGFYASRSRPVSRRAQQNEKLKARIVSLHEASDGVYGSPRIFKDLLEEGFEVGRHRIARIMKKAGIVGVTRRKRQSLTKRDERRAAAPNVLEQDFEATAPNQKWAADITYVRTHEGFVYLAVVLDLFSRRVVGWAMSTSLDTTIVLRALAMALLNRTPSKNLVHHSDRGCQYTSKAFSTALQDAGITCSMSGVGNCYDNAVVESFFASLKTERLYRRTLGTQKQARIEVFDYIERFYNRRRRHSANGQISPVNYEEQFHAAFAA